MSDESTIDDQSHYEISLTAGQAFVAFVLLLLSLAASFAFGLMIGRGQGDDRLVVKREPSVVTEAAVIPKKSGKIVELGATDDDFKETKVAPTDTAATAAPVLTEGPATATDTSAAEVARTQAADTAAPAKAPVEAASTPAKAPAAVDAAHAAVKSGPVYAQLLSTSDQKTAEALAAKAINGGYSAAYVERGTSEKGPVFRVRVRFASEADARAAEPKLREFAKDVWIVK